MTLIIRHPDFHSHDTRRDNRISELEATVGRKEKEIISLKNTIENIVRAASDNKPITIVDHDGKEYHLKTHGQTEEKKDLPPFVVVDIIAERGKDILFIKRKKDPFKGYQALPGGFVDPGETVPEAACRELREETGLVVDASAMRLIGVFSDPSRDPRGPVISIVYACTPESDQLAYAGDDAKEVNWLDPGPMMNKLAFDHGEMISKYLAWKGV